MYKIDDSDINDSTRLLHELLHENKDYNIFKKSDATIEGATLYADEQKKSMMLYVDDIVNLQKSKKLYRLQKKQIADKNGKVTTVYVRIDNNTGKEQETYTGKQYTTAKDEKVRAIAKERKIAIPPAWHDLWIADSAKAPLQVVGKDDKNRIQMRYNAEYVEESAKQKFKRLEKLLEEMPKIVQKLKKNMAKSEDAKVLYLIANTGIRIGSERDTKADVEAHGATTLLKKHVIIEKDKAILNFIGKKGVDYRTVVTDSDAVQMLKQKIASIQSDDAKIFNTDDMHVRNYLKKKVDKRFDVKDFRTAIATNEAQRILMQEVPTQIKSKKELKSAEKLICTKVSNVLCNTPTVAKKAYIHTFIFDELNARMVS